MKMKATATLALAAIALAAVPAFAQVQISRDGRPEKIFRPISGLNTMDVHFLREAAIINLFEIKSSQLAGEKSSNAFVTEYAKEMIADHQMAFAELKEIAESKGVSLPQDLPPDLMRLYRHLENQSGTTFDAAYQNAQRSGHANASNEFKGEIENGKDEDVKAFAVKTLPTVEMHYRMMLTQTTMMGSTKMDHGN